MRDYSMPACKKNRDLVLKMVSEGKTLTEIAEAVGTGRRHVKTFLERDEGIYKKWPRANGPGEKNGHWKGGRQIDGDGYVLLRCVGHPFAKEGGGSYVFEHRLVMEKLLGRYLLPSEVVHHRNKNKQDNRPENLELFASNAEHLAMELKGCVPKWTEQGLKRIQEGLLLGQAILREQNRRKSKLGGSQLP